MKNLKYLLSISLLTISFSFTFAAEDEEIKTIEIDGTIYKINNTSLHISPLDENVQDNAILKASDTMNSASNLKNENQKENSIDSKEKKSLEPCVNCISLSVGTVTALGDESDDYDNGTSLSIIAPTPWKFNLFNKEWSVYGELNLSNLSNIASGNDMNMNSVIANLNTEFDLPVDITFGLGLTHSPEGDGLGTLSGTGTVNVKYTLPVEAAHLSLGFKYQKYIDIMKEDPYLDFGLLDTFGFNLNFSKELNF